MAIASSTSKYSLAAGPPALDESLGKVWLLPYMTRKDSGQKTPVSETWYDELVIARQRIADPT